MNSESSGVDPKKVQVLSLMRILVMITICGNRPIECSEDLLIAITRNRKEVAMAVETEAEATEKPVRDG